VIDEPSVFDYSPQHQSTCGLFFNEPVAGGPVFGPASWQGDALVCGYSRGKLYRTKLVKTPAGYVAQNNLIASLNMLTADACVSPRGELVVAVHSGGPDWGSGPTGPGKLYKIAYRDQNVAQPVTAWPASPSEVHIAFDRPLDEKQLKLLTDKSKVSIEFGEQVRAGDRFESFRPGYEVVSRQMSAQRRDLAVHSVQVSPDLRTLILSTSRHPQDAHYAMTLPRQAEAAAALSQHATIDLDYDLCGVAAEFASDGKTLWSGWLPHFDLQVSRTFTEQSAEHQLLWKLLEENRGALHLTARISAKSMLRPAVQPGARIDYEWPEESVQWHFTSSRPYEAHWADGDEDARELRVSLEIDPQVSTEFEIAWSTNEDDRRRALPLSRMKLPWAPEAGAAQEASPAPYERPELAGGDWSRGRKLFFSEEAACSKCHTHFGNGGRIGPDLSNLSERDYASVLRDVKEPSYAINPDFLAYSAELIDGRVLTGSVRTEGGKLHIGDDKGEVAVVDPSDIERMQALPISTMPKGIDEKIGAGALKDLLTFLLSAPPRMPDYGPQKPPPARTKAEVNAILAGAVKDDREMSTVRIVLVAGPKDHGPGEHDYPAWQETWAKLLAIDESVKVSTASPWPSEEDLKTADCLVFYQHGDWNNEKARQIDEYLRRGGGLVYLHYAVDGGADPAGFAERIGLAWKGGESRFRHGELVLDFKPGKDHPIARNFDKAAFHDESYWKLVGDPTKIQLLADGEEEGERQPLFWTCEREKGRVFVSILGHFSWTFDDPLFRALVLRGIAWTTRQNVDRFNDLVLPGARVE
jgi:putative heme-binding domain-containing protein